MIKVNVLFNNSWQEKSFADETKLIEWCRRNADKIFCINDYRTFGAKLSPFAIMDAVRGMEN